MKQRRKKGLWPIVALFVALGGQQASSNIIMSHVGTNDPLSEGCLWPLPLAGQVWR